MRTPRRLYRSFVNTYMSKITAAVGGQTALDPAVEVLPEEVVELTDPFVQIVTFSVSTVVIVLIGWFVVEPAISRLVRRRNQNNPTLEEAISRYIRLFLILFGVFVGLSVAGYGNVVGNSALIIAAATLALGVAGQSVIGSLVSGVALVVDPQFNIGNYIRWDDGEGEVTSITLRVTRVQTPDGGLVTIPNTTLTNEPIVRPYEQESYRMTDRVEISYEADVDHALSTFLDVATGMNDILDEPAPEVDVVELGGNGVVLEIQYWIVDPIWNSSAVRSELMQAVLARFEENGIEISPSSKRDLEGRIQVANPQMEQK